MKILKVIEVVASSEKSWEDATQKAISEAAETLKGIKSIYQNHQEQKSNMAKTTEYTINAKISFTVEH